MSAPAITPAGATALIADFATICIAWGDTCLAVRLPGGDLTAHFFGGVCECAARALVHDDNDQLPALRREHGVHEHRRGDQHGNLPSRSKLIRAGKRLDEAKRDLDKYEKRINVFEIVTGTDPAFREMLTIWLERGHPKDSGEPKNS